MTRVVKNDSEAKDMSTQDSTQQFEHALPTD